MNTNPDQKCELCGEPMPPGEEMFKFHGYSGPCPKPPLPRAEPTVAELRECLSNIVKSYPQRVIMLPHVKRGRELLAMGPLPEPPARTIDDRDDPDIHGH